MIMIMIPEGRARGRNAAGKAPPSPRLIHIYIYIYIHMTYMCSVICIISYLDVGRAYFHIANVMFTCCTYISGPAQCTPGGRRPSAHAYIYIYVCSISLSLYIYVYIHTCICVYMQPNFPTKPSLPTNNFGFGGFDSSRLLILRGVNSHVRVIL